MLPFLRIGGSERTETRGDFVGCPRQIGTDHLPAIAAIRGLEKRVRGKIQRVWIERRKNYRQSSIVTVFAAANRLRRNVRHFADVLLGSRKPRAVNNVGVERIDGDVPVLEDSNGVPLAKADFSVIAPAHCSRRAAFLLRAVNPVRKPVVRGDMIELRCRLIVPTAPRRAPVYADDCALIGTERDDLRILGADPDALVIVAARRALETNKRFPAVAGFPRRGIRNVKYVRIVRRHRDAQRAGTAPADSPVAVHPLPALAAVARRSPHGAKRNAGPRVPDFAPLHPGYQPTLALPRRPGGPVSGW